MTPMQYHIERHTPAKLAQAYRVAADTAERNPYLPPGERAKRARLFREQAQEFECRIARASAAIHTETRKLKCLTWRD